MNLDTSFNIEPDFNQFLEEQLGQYVYILTDPTENNRPFYVGKGGGNGAGNRRIIEHFEEARKLSLSEKNNPKVRKIHNIWRQGQHVHWYVLKTLNYCEINTIGEEIEGAIIQFANLVNQKLLVNKNRGNSCVLMSRFEVMALAAEELSIETFPDILIERPIFLFNIAKGFANTGCHRKALVGDWKINHKHRELPKSIAVGLIDQVSYSSLSIEGWKTAKTHGRFAMIPNATENSLVNKNFRAILEPVLGYWQYGSGGGAIVFKISKDRQLVYLRGKRNGIF